MSCVTNEETTNAISTVKTSDELMTSATSTPPTKFTKNDFVFIKLIGEGSFSMVFLAKDVATRRDWAVKVCEKKFIRREKKEEAIMREKKIMNMINLKSSPFIINLFCTFQDTERLYFVVNYARNGELLSYITKLGSFDETCARFYGAEILLGVEHLHKLGITHRDLKPENILLNEQRHIQITDFGSAFHLNENSNNSSNMQSSATAATQSEHSNNIQERRRKNSFVGTAQYVSPEMLTSKVAVPSSDLWAFGCIIYQMIAGFPPFRESNEYLIFKKITKLEYDFPEGFNPKAKKIVTSLLKLEAKQRLGATDNLNAQGYISIKSHEFFSELENSWSTLHLQTPPPLAPFAPEYDEVIGQENIEPGLDDRQMTRLLGLSLNDVESQQNDIIKEFTELSDTEFKSRLNLQERDNQWHRFVENNLIIKQGFVDKKKGLFARRRMFLLTTGPHLYYVEPQALVLKGEVPWSSDMAAETRTFRSFTVNTPNRIYYLEDPLGGSPEWCNLINSLRNHYFGPERTSSSSSQTNTSNNQDSSSTLKKYTHFIKKTR